MEFVAGGSMSETIGGAGACVLAIVGLSGLLPGYLAAIATVAAGAALFLEGGAILSRYSQLLRETMEHHGSTAAFEGGMSAESVGGLAVVALGILALVGVAPLMLMSIALIVLGGALLFGSATTSRLNALRISTGLSVPETHPIAREAVSAAAGAQVLIGIGVIVLGILAVVGVDPLKLVLVGLLAGGSAVLLSGSAISGKMVSGLHGT